MPPAVTLEKSHLAIPVIFYGQEEYTKIQASESENISDKARNFLTALESCWPILTLHKTGRNFEEENYFLFPALEEDKDHGFIASMGRTVMHEVQERKTQSPTCAQHRKPPAGQTFFFFTSKFKMGSRSNCRGFSFKEQLLFWFAGGLLLACTSGISKYPCTLLYK